MGGEFISVGSDSHTVEDIGTDVDEGAKIAAAAGFEHLTYFKNRRPDFIKIN